MQLGLTAQGNFRAPLADYSAGLFESTWLRHAAAGLAGLALVYGLCLAVGRFLMRQRSA